jgi:RNA polymerase sigma-70 factor (ECF subfamily)
LTGERTLVSNELSIAIDGREWQSILRARTAERAGAQVDPDVALIERCRAGDEAAFQALVGRYQKKAFWIAHDMLHDKEEALDIVQEAFVRVFRSLDRFDTSRKFYTWLYRIVSNLCIDALRKAPRQRAISLDTLGDTIPRGGSPSDALEKEELGKQIEQILSVMPQKYKLMIVLRDVEGHSCKEIARIAGCSHANVRWRLHKARRLFKELWERRFVAKGVQAS